MSTITSIGFLFHEIFNLSDSINSKKSAHIQRISGHEFSVAHYTGKITYDARDLADKNRDFLPPEMVRHIKNA